MKTNFTSDLDSIMRLSGSVSSDSTTAKIAAEEIEGFAKEQAAIIKEFVVLKCVVTFSSESNIKNAVSSLRHICAALQQLCRFFALSTIVDYFDPARLRVEKLLAQAEGDAKKLLAYVYR